MPAPIRILVVDDSMLYRTIVRESLARIPNVEVIGSANNGRNAIEKISSLNPDLITLDFEMPEVDGLGVLRWLRDQRLPTKALMISALTCEGAAETLKALQAGALDFVVKPNGSNAQQNQAELIESLKIHVQTVQYLLEKQATKTHTPSPIPASRRVAPSTPTLTPAAVKTRADRISKAVKHPVSAIGIGVSTGGPDALRVMLPMLPANIGVPVLVVQHMPPVFTKSLADALDKLCKLRVHEAEEGQVVRAGEILIAPGGRQMKLVREADQVKVRLTDDAPVQSCKPSVDYMFDSLHQVYGPRALSVIMTGMGCDGSDAAKRLHDIGGHLIVQDEASCVVFGMPRRPVVEGYADVVCPLDKIADEIVHFVRNS